ncbi:MAG: hypothetical protein GX331_06430 [Firmicutes bacterium]|nr:hypothetical protein [Bacillota bacterium]
MFFRKMREQTKVIVIIIVIAFVGGLLYTGGVSFFRGRNQQQVVQAAVATVNGQAISYYDFHQAFISQLQRIEQQQGILPGRSYETLKYQTLDLIIGNVLISQEIANREIDVSNAEIEEELQKIVDQFPSRDDYELQLEMIGWTEDQIKQILAEEIRFEKLRDEVIGDIPVSDEELIEAYEEVRASHILVRPETDDDGGWAAAEAEALEILAQLTVDNFAELAVEYSQDGSASNGGDLGFIRRGQTVAEFEEAAFSLKVNEISEPVRSSFGYHIITVTERKDAVGQEFEEAKEDLIQTIRAEKGEEKLQAWYEQLHTDADIIVTDFQMNAFKQVVEGNYEDAVHYYTLAIEENPNDGYLYASLGDVYGLLEQPEEALTQYEKAVEKITNDSSLYITLGNAYRELEKIDEAVEAYLTASQLAPLDLYTQLILYNYVSGLERYEDAKVIEQRIEEIQERQAELRKMQEEAVQAQEDDSADGQVEEAEPVEEMPEEAAAPEN